MEGASLQFWPCCLQRNFLVYYPGSSSIQNETSSQLFGHDCATESCSQRKQMAWERNHVLGSSVGSENKTGGEMVMSPMEFCSIVNSTRLALHLLRATWIYSSYLQNFYLVCNFSDTAFKKKHLFSTKEEWKEGRNKESISICKLSDFLCIVIFPWYKSFEFNCYYINNFSVSFSQIFFLSSLLN